MGSKSISECLTKIFFSTAIITGSIGLAGTFGDEFYQTASSREVSRNISNITYTVAIVSTGIATASAIVSLMR